MHERWLQAARLRRDEEANAAAGPNAVLGGGEEGGRGEVQEMNPMVESEIPREKVRATNSRMNTLGFACAF